MGLSKLMWSRWWSVVTGRQLPRRWLVRVALCLQQTRTLVVCNLWCLWTYGFVIDSKVWTCFQWINLTVLTCLHWSLAVCAHVPPSISIIQTKIIHGRLNSLAWAGDPSSTIGWISIHVLWIGIMHSCWIVNITAWDSNFACRATAAIFSLEFKFWIPEVAVRNQ